MFAKRHTIRAKFKRQLRITVGAFDAHGVGLRNKFSLLADLVANKRNADLPRYFLLFLIKQTPQKQGLFLIAKNVSATLIRHWMQRGL